MLSICVAICIYFQWVCVELNSKYEYLLVLTWYLFPESKYMHSCETGYIDILAFYRKHVLYGLLIEGRNWLIIYVYYPVR